MPVAPSGNDQLCNTPNKRPCLQRDLDSGQKTNVKHKGFPAKGRKTLFLQMFIYHLIYILSLVFALDLDGGPGRIV